MAVTGALLLGVVVGVAVALALTRRAPGPAPTPGSASGPVAGVVPPALARRVLEVMGSAAVVVDEADEVVLANPAARRMGVVRGGRVVVDELRRLAREARRDGEPRTAVVDLSLIHI